MGCWDMLFWGGVVVAALFAVEMVCRAFVIRKQTRRQYTTPFTIRKATCSCGYQFAFVEDEVWFNADEFSVTYCPVCPKCDTVLQVRVLRNKGES